LRKAQVSQGATLKELEPFIRHGELLQAGKRSNVKSWMLDKVKNPASPAALRIVEEGAW
jgi:hypothetical protein